METTTVFATGGYYSRVRSAEYDCGMDWPQSRDVAFDGVDAIDPLDAPDVMPAGSAVGNDYGGALQLAFGQTVRRQS